MKCDICESEKFYVKEYNHEFYIKGKKITFISKRRFCENCNNLVYDPVLDNRASEIAIAKYNEEYGITKEEIIELRKKFNLSQELFSKVIGCAKKTLISYEKGKSIPNDSYLILLKSMQAKPDTIKTLIDANIKQFTDKEYEKISNKIVDVLPNNMKQLIVNNNDHPNEYNGYSKFSKEKIYNIILFFSKEAVLKTKLLKEMFYSDFLYYKKSCKSMTGLEYAKLPYGPVPDQFEDILNKCAQEKIIDYTVDFISDYEFHNIYAKKEFDASLFTEEELVILNKIKKKFESFGSKDIVEFSHKEQAFIETKPLSKISYDYAFDIESI